MANVYLGAVDWNDGVDWVLYGVLDHSVPLSQVFVNWYNDTLIGDGG